MDHITRRQMLIGSAALLGASAMRAKGKLGPKVAPPEVGKVDPIGSDIYFHEGNLAQGHCNNGWVVFEDYVLVIDGSFPKSVDELIPKIRAITDKPIRFAFDTHHHGDHAYGNQKMVENGAAAVAHTGVIEEMKRYETGYYGGAPGRWESTARSREDVRNSRLKPPSVLFPHELIFDDGKHRVELMHLGVAHTHGDAVAWLPKERILFTGDMCVNGPYNYVGDGDVRQWVATLDAARKLDAKIVCTGHGPRSTATVLDDQQAFFRALREQVGTVMTNIPADQAKAKIETIRATLKSNGQIARFVSNRDAGSDDGFPSQVAKVYQELTGNKLAALAHEPYLARHTHARSHGLAIA